MNTRLKAWLHGALVTLTMVAGVGILFAQQPVQILDSNRAIVNPGSLLTHDSAFTAIGTTGGASMGIGSSTAPTAVTSGRAVIPWFTLNGGFNTQLISGTTLYQGATETTLDARTGALTEAAPASDTASSGINGRLQRIAQRLTSVIALLPTALGSGGGLKIDGSGTALPVTPTAATIGGATPSLYISAATNNSTNLKASAGTLYSAVVINTTATLKFIRFYDSASAPTCTSATNAVFYSPIPANSTTGAGFVIPMPVGANFASGIGWCITGAAGTTDNTSTAVGDVVLNVSYK